MQIIYRKNDEYCVTEVWCIIVIMKFFFRKTIKFNKKEAESTSHFSSCIKKFKKWDRTLASIFGLLAFFTLMGFGIYNIFKPKTCTDCKPKGEASSEDNQEEKLRKTPTSKSICTNKSCKMVCQNIKENESIENYINIALNETEPPCSEITLDIEFTAFPKAQLSNGWLENINPSVTALRIYQGTLKEINEKAFEGRPFEKNLKTLRILDTSIKVLRNNSFLGLRSVNYFDFQSNTLRDLEVHEKALTGMGDALDTLQLTNFMLTSKDIINLVGDQGVSRNNIIKLVLSDNHIPELLKNSFTSVNFVTLTSLYLSKSGIETIHKETFSGMTNLKLLHLDGNALTTLEAGTFNSLSNLKLQNLRLGGNNWNCTCSLQWLKDYFNETSVSSPPLCNNTTPFEDVHFCSNGPEPTPSPSSSPQTGSIPTSTKSTTSTSGTNPECSEIRSKLGIKILQCKNERTSPKYKSAAIEASHNAEIIVDGQKVRLHLQELEGNPLEVKVVIEEPADIIKNHYLVWTSSEDKNKYGCETPLENGLILQLERGTTYTFSVLYECESETSPKCTFGLKTLPEWPFRTWISNEYQAAAIGVTVLIAICVIGFTSLVTFLCIRRHPKLISGNKSVIIVKPTKSEESIPSREYERPQYWEPSVMASTQGYLTPNCHRYARIKYRPPLMRSISEWSVSSNPSMYGQPPQWRPPHTGRQNQKLERMEGHAYQDYRPPLPPPNPGPSYGSSTEVPEDLIYSSV